MHEHNNAVDLLKSERIEPHIQYNRQRETIITWSDKHREQDLAVSFQTNFGAQYTWRKICQILHMDPHENSPPNSEIPEEPLELALLSSEQLPRLADELKNVNAIDNEAQQDIIEHFLGNDCQNLTKLGELFTECEAEVNDRKSSAENLMPHFYIFKGLIQLNDQRMLETIMSEKYYLFTFGALEWDPDGLQSPMDDVLRDNEEQEQQKTADQQQNFE